MRTELRMSMTHPLTCGSRWTMNFLDFRGTDYFSDGSGGDVCWDCANFSVFAVSH